MTEPPVWDQWDTPVPFFAEHYGHVSFRAGDVVFPEMILWEAEE